MNMNKRTLKFIIDNEDKGDSYKDIPIDKMKIKETEYKLEIDNTFAK